MSYSEFNDFLKKCGVSRTDAEDGEVVLTKDDALKALKLLVGTDLIVLGGDVYELESDGYFRPTYDNWYFNKDNYLPLEAAKKSQEKAIEYLNGYRELEDSNIRYVFVLDV
ncbi:Imm40 family immunity protein [Marinomonas primoryensis]|uniref:Imm40 family immunity protein n=1 Tax=Marinomonas primoryensis TaxID=178399 RepID=UPI003704985B